MEEQGEINIGYQGDDEMTWMCFFFGVSVVWDFFFIQDLDPVIQLMTIISNSSGSVDPLELIQFL